MQINFVEHVVQVDKVCLGHYFTCQCGAVLGNPCFSHSRLCRCHCAAATRHRPSGVHLRTTLCHDSHPPTANNHQSKIESIVQPAPAPHRHFLLILCNLPLLVWLCFALLLK